MKAIHKICLFVQITVEDRPIRPSNDIVKILMPVILSLLTGFPDEQGIIFFLLLKRDILSTNINN